MNRFVKSLLVGVAVTIAAQGFSFADTLSSESIADISKTTNTDMLLLELQLMREEESYEKAKALAVGVVLNKDDDEGIPYSDIVVRDLNPLNAEKNFLDKKYETIQKTNILELEALERYFTLLNLEQDKITKKEDYDFVKSKYESKLKEFEVGQITEIDLQKFELTLSETFLTYMRANSDYQSAKRALNIFMSNDVENPVVLEPVAFPVPELIDVNLDHISVSIIENSYRIDQIEKEVAITEMDMKLKSRFKGYGDKQIEINTLEDKVFNLKSQLESAKRQVKADLYDKFYDVEIAKENQKIKELDYLIATKNFNVAQLRYDNGLISTIDYLQAKQDLKKAEFVVNDSKLSYYLTVERFNDYISENDTAVTTK